MLANYTALNDEKNALFREAVEFAKWVQTEKKKHLEETRGGERVKRTLSRAQELMVNLKKKKGGRSKTTARLLTTPSSF